MELKMTIQGIFIYAAMGTYFIAGLLTIFRCKRAGSVIFGLGFIAAASAFGYRWIHVGHWPMQNLFEVFITLGMLCFPVSLFCKNILKISGQAGDMLIGFIILFPAGFVFTAEPQQLPPALQSDLFAPHVAAYMIGYAFMLKAMLCAFSQLFQIKTEDKMLSHEQAAYTMICLGFPFLTMGLFLGSWWGKLAWGDYWGWDPKELWSLASWLVYAGYFHFRYMFGKKYANLNSIWAITGMVFIVITLLWVNLSNTFSGLHNYAS